MACPECASRDLRNASATDGFVPETGEGLSYWVCRRCGYLGVPLEFEEQGDYDAFVESKR